MSTELDDIFSDGKYIADDKLKETSYIERETDKQGVVNVLMFCDKSLNDFYGIGDGWDRFDDFCKYLDNNWIRTRYGWARPGAFLNTNVGALEIAKRAKRIQQLADLMLGVSLHQAKIMIDKME